MSESIERALSVYTHLVDQGVDPTYAQVQVKHSADRLGEMDADELAADILSNTPQKFVSKPADASEDQPPPYDPVAAGKQMAAAARAKNDSRDAFR